MRRLLPLFIAILGGLFLAAVRIFAQGGTTIYLPMVARADVVTATVVYTPTWWASIYSADLSGDYQRAYEGKGDWNGLIEGIFALAKDCSRGCLVERALYELQSANNSPAGEVISASVIVSATIGSYNPNTVIYEPLNVHLGTWTNRSPQWYDFDPVPSGRWTPPVPEVHLHEVYTRIPLGAFVGAPPPETIKLLFRLDDQNPPAADHIRGEVWPWPRPWYDEAPAMPRVELIVRVEP